MKKIFCQKLKRETDALEKAPYPGELGQKIFESISQEAWNSWIQHQTILINEYHLNTLDPMARKFLLEEMQGFLFDA